MIDVGRFRVPLFTKNIPFCKLPPSRSWLLKPDIIPRIIGIIMDKNTAEAFWQESRIGTNQVGNNPIFVLKTINLIWSTRTYLLVKDNADWIEVALIETNEKIPWIIMDNITVKVVEAFQYDAKVENHTNLVWKIWWNFDFVYKYAKIILSFCL